VSLRAWASDIEPYDTLDEVWVQIKGVPPPMEQVEMIVTNSLLLGQDVRNRLELTFLHFFSMVGVLDYL
jgi:hypothetical protein